MTTTGYGGGVTYGRALELKTRDEGWTVEGYVSTYDVDLGHDKVLPGAYKGTLSDGHKVRFLYGHDQTKVLGVPTSLAEDGTKGLYGRFKISRTALGEDVRRLLLDGALDSFSVGFIARDWDHDPRSGVRSLKSIDLLECSVVALPMNTAALVTSAKWAQGPAPRAAALRSPLVARLEAAVVRLRRKAFLAGMTDREARGYAALLRSRLPGANTAVARSSGGR